MAVYHRGFVVYGTRNMRGSFRKANSPNFKLFGSGPV